METMESVWSLFERNFLFFFHSRRISSFVFAFTIEKRNKAQKKKRRKRRLRQQSTGSIGKKLYMHVINGVYGCKYTHRKCSASYRFQLSGALFLCESVCTFNLIFLLLNCHYSTHQKHRRTATHPSILSLRAFSSSLSLYVQRE